MRIVEILLPGGTSDKGLSPQAARKIDLLQKRMDVYVDKILSPNTSRSGKEFLKSRLRDDYYELREILPKVHHIAEEQQEVPLQTQYEVYDRKTGLNVPGRGPYNSKIRARMAVDQLDNKYGAYRYQYRQIGQKIDELFTGGKQWKTTFSGSEEYTAEFQTGNVDYLFHAYKPWPTYEPGFWDVEFKVTNAKRARRGEGDAEEHQRKFGITGTGNSAEVMSTVVDIMRSFLREHKDISKLTFSAKESSRQRLYKAMISRLLPGWELKADGIEYTLTKPQNMISEAVHKLPLSNDDFELVKEIMSRPIPAAVAPIYISEIIVDDELNDQLKSLEETDPGRDVRPMIAEWFKRVMPDQMYHFTGDHRSENLAQGLLSPIHGYDPHIYKGQNNPTSGNAYGRR